MSEYNPKNFLTQKNNNINVRTTSRQVNHNGKTVENCIDDIEMMLNSMQIVSYYKLENIGAKSEESPSIIIEKVPSNSICIFVKDELLHEDWNFPETQGFIKIEKGVSVTPILEKKENEDEENKRVTGKTQTIVTFKGASEYRFINNIWEKIVFSSEVSLLEGGIGIPKEEDLDNYVEIGNYYNTNITHGILNCPISSAFTLRVINAAGNAKIRRIQVVTPYSVNFDNSFEYRRVLLFNEESDTFEPETSWYKSVRSIPRLTSEQKQDMKDLMDQYQRVRNTLFYYAGSVRRESYANESGLGYGTVTRYAYNTPDYPILKHKNENINEENPNQYYYKYMLNCGVFCQMIWMGRPISDFLSGADSNEEEKRLLNYAEAEGTTVSPKKYALTSLPKLTTSINSVFKDSKSGKPWGYYFDFLLSKKAFGSKNDSGVLYNSISYWKYNNIKIINSPENNNYTSIEDKDSRGQIMDKSINQITANIKFELKPKDFIIKAGDKINLGSIDPTYKPKHIISLIAYDDIDVFETSIEDDGKIFIICNKNLEKRDEPYNIFVNIIYIPETRVEFLREKLPLGFDGASAMAEELYRIGCEVPREEMDIGDLVFYRADDISDENEDILANRAFRNITHVGIVYDIDENGEPTIMDCTNSYINPSALGQTSLNSSTAYAIAKSAYQHNQTVMVARHPAAYGKGGNVPSEFKPYRKKS